MMYEASNVSYSRLAEIGKRLRERLAGANTIRVTCPGGTDITFDTAGRRWLVSDGVVGDEDIAEENFGDEIPAGNIHVAPLEESANGKVAFNVVTPYSGLNMKSMSWTFKGGKVAEFTGDAVAKRLRQLWEKSTGDKDRIGYFGIGFNPKAEVGYTISNVASGAVSIGIGANVDSGGKNDSTFFYPGTLTGATVLADGKPVVERGVLLKEFAARP
jgi:leucyl aminopeptidase (aminopeptidase T)